MKGVSIHAFREEGDRVYASPTWETVAVSFHAFREEGDGEPRQAAQTLTAVSIHAFREEGDVICLSAHKFHA